MKKLLHFFNWLRFLYVLNGAFFGLILGVLGNKFSGSGSLTSFSYLIPLLLISGITTLILEARRKRFIDVTLKATTLRTEQEKESSARKGLIALVSLYNPIKKADKPDLSQQEREEAANRKDYKTLDLETSNLQTVIEAICSHRYALQHCWLIGTTDSENTKGSIIYQDALIEFLRKEKGINCNFHYGKDYAIPLDDDALICEKTYRMIKRILIEASAFGIEGKDIIADYSGGFRSMVSGMILAYLHGDNDIQLMGTKYDVFARPKGPLFPINISFEPEIKTHE